MASETNLQTLWEVVDWQTPGLRVDRQAGLIRGVKILGLRSRNGRVYLPEALQEAASLYEGAKVNINHAPSLTPTPRDYRDRLGLLRQVAFQPGEGLFADLRFNPKHPLAEQLAWDAEHCPENVGLSHHVEARLSRREGQTVVEAILRVHSVDVVADPATTQGLFESVGSLPAGGPSVDPQQPLPPGQVAASGVQPADAQAERIVVLEAELERLRAVQAEANRRLLIQRLLAEHRLPGPESTDPIARWIASPEFIQALLTAPDEATVRGLIEDRARLVERLLQEAVSAKWRGLLSGPSLGQPSSHCVAPLALGRLAPERPVSRDQLALAGMVRDVHEFVRAIT